MDLGPTCQATLKKIKVWKIRKREIICFSIPTRPCFSGRRRALLRSGRRRAGAADERRCRCAPPRDRGLAPYLYASPSPLARGRRRRNPARGKWSWPRTTAGACPYLSASTARAQLAPTPLARSRRPCHGRIAPSRRRREGPRVNLISTPVRPCPVLHFGRRNRALVLPFVDIVVVFSTSGQTRRRPKLLCLSERMSPPAARSLSRTTPPSGSDPPAARFPPRTTPPPCPASGGRAQRGGGRAGGAGGEYGRNLAGVGLAGGEDRATARTGDELAAAV